MVVCLLRLLILVDVISRVNPHIIVPARPEDRAEAKRRRDVLGILQFDAEGSNGEKEFSNLPGFPLGVVYARQAQNRYQGWLRHEIEENGSSKKVTAHYTTRWKSKIVEATANVPLQALADHRGILLCCLLNPKILKSTSDLDDIFLPDRAKAPKQNKQLG